MHVRAEQDVTVAEAALLQALGLEDAGTIELVAPEGTAEAGASFEERLARAVAERADLRSLESRVRQAELGQKLARRHNLADLGVMASYEWNGDALLAADGRNWAAGLGLRVSVFDGRETAARVARSRADASRLRAFRDALLQRIRLDVRTAWAEFESAKGEFDAASTAVESSREALRIVQDRYEEGLALIVELLSAEAAYTRAQAELVASRGRIWLARAGLDLASGYRLWSHAIASGGE
jgi:outer membrane protein TolC